MSKTLLVLGGAAKSLPLVRSALVKGHRVVLCDRDPTNPCRQLATHFAEISTLDVDGLVAVADDHAVDGVVSFGSDRMAEVAAQVAERRGLPGNPPASLRTMGRKDLFRAFLGEHGFARPGSISGNRLDVMDAARDQVRLPAIVKPVDAAGSAGVARIDRWEDLPAALHHAELMSPMRGVIVEEFIERDHDYVIAGDAFVDRGEVVFWGLLNSHRGAGHAPFLPTGTSYPISLSAVRQKQVCEKVQTLVDALGIQFGPLNLELAFGADGVLHVIELAARNGGNCIPELLQDATGVDLIGALVDASLGEQVHLTPQSRQRCLATYVVHTVIAGRFEALELDEMVRPHLYRAVSYARSGDSIHMFRRATDAVGVLFLEFASPAEQKAVLECIEDYVRLRMETDEVVGA